MFLLLPVLFGCGDRRAGDGPELADPPSVASCGPVWGEDRCADGCPDPGDAVWAEGYVDRLASGWAASRSEVESIVHVRSVEREGEPTEDAKLVVQLNLDGLTTTFRVWGSHTPAPASVEEASVALAGSVPRDDPWAPVRPWDELARVVRACERELDVVFEPEQLCSSAVPFVLSDARGHSGATLTAQTFETPTDQYCARVTAGLWDEGLDACWMEQCVVVIH